MPHRAITLEDIKRIARNANKNGGFIRKEVRISSKPDFVDKVAERTEKLLKRLNSSY